MSGDVPIIDVEELLNPDEQQQFRALCMPTSAAELAQLGEVVELHLDQTQELAGPEADLETAAAIARSLCALLGGDHEFNAQDRALIRGAVEYFLLADDAAGDLEDALGFDDDARVVNSVLGRVGHPEYRIELG